MPVSARVASGSLPRTNMASLTISNPPKTSQVAVVVPPVVPPELTNKPATLEVAKNIPKTSDLEVTQVPNDFVIQPPHDVGAANPAKNTASQAATATPSQNPDSSKPDKRTLFSKL